MGFMKNVGAGLLSGLAGTNTSAGNLATLGIGSVLGAIGGSNNGTKASGSQTARQSAQTSNFRNGLYSGLQTEINKANEPIYGDAEKSSYVANLNDLSKAATESLTNSLAARGITNSGATAQGITDIETNRASKATDYFASLPGLEDQARTNKLNSLYQTSAGLVGQEPTSYTTTGTSSDSTPWWKKLMSGMGGIMTSGAGKSTQKSTFGTSTEDLWD